MDIVLYPQTIVEWDEAERVRPFQISKKYREDMLQYIQHESLGDEVRSSPVDYPGRAM